MGKEKPREYKGLTMKKDEYMVHFKFKLSPIDAENLANLFMHEIWELRSKMIRELGSESKKKDGPMLDWLKQRMRYIESLQDIVVGSSKAINVEDGSVRIESVNEWDKDW